jgi:hypothetical protein
MEGFVEGTRGTTGHGLVRRYKKTEVAQRCQLVRMFSVTSNVKLTS